MNKITECVIDNEYELSLALASDESVGYDPYNSANCYMKRVSFARPDSRHDQRDWRFSGELSFLLKKQAG